MDDQRKTLLPSVTFGDSSMDSNSHSRTIQPANSPIKQLPPYPPTSINAIVSTTMSQPIRKNPMDIQSSLMSPPEPILHDSFSRPSTSDSNMKLSYGQPTASRFDPPLSPPVSPESSNSTPDSPSSANRDPILFPNTELQTAPSTRPLFPTQQQVVIEHIRDRDSSVFRKASPPQPTEYNLGLEFQRTFQASFLKTVQQNPRAWIARERAFLKADDLARRGGQRYTPIAPASHGPRKAGGRANNGPRVNANGGVTKPRAPKAVRERQSTPDGSKKEKSTRVDKDFNNIKDYSPPIGHSLDNPNALKIDWKGAPIDLTNDAHRHLLHPNEIKCASTLRLDCATFLTSKRRIFESRVNALSIKKEFRKTDAQQACKIDVNKASKLWDAFNKVGWLEPEWFRQFVPKKEGEQKA